jgi:hypothetical protein
MIWRIREALQVLSADRVRESLDCIGLYTNLGGVDVRAGNANHIQGGRTFMRTTISECDTLRQLCPAGNQVCQQRSGDYRAKSLSDPLCIRSHVQRTRQHA